MKNINKIKRLIKSECAGFLSELCHINNYCCDKDMVCLFFEDNKELQSCINFEDGVLPLDSDLEIEYRREHNMEPSENIKAKSKVKCEKCGETFDANSNRQKLCEKCKKIVKKEQGRARQNKFKANKAGYNALEGCGTH